MSRICLFPTQQEAADALALFEQRARMLWAQAGYAVDDQGVVPKRGGVDALDAQRTVKWDDLHEHPDGWYFAHPAPQFAEYAEALLEGMQFTDVEYLPPIEGGI